MASKAGALAARAYFPGGKGRFTVVVYYHGGGWVVADINVEDGAPREIPLGATAVVVSAEYPMHPSTSSLPRTGMDGQR
jgi:acetyl esterase/lipase